AVEFLAPFARELLGIVEALAEDLRQLLLIEDHRGGDHRARERCTANLIDTGNDRRRLVFQNRALEPEGRHFTPGPPRPVSGRRRFPRAVARVIVHRDYFSISRGISST